MFAELKTKDHCDILRYLNLETLQEMRNRQDLIGVFKMCKGFIKMEVNYLQWIYM